MNILGFIDDQARNGSLNMAVDDYLAYGPYWPEITAVMRLYMWQRPTLSCGFHQKVGKRINFANCRKHNVDLARRPTGGRELLHDGDLSFCIVGYKRIDEGSAIGTAKDFFFKAGNVLIGGLKGIGIEASIEVGGVKRNDHDLTPCLAAISQYELCYQGRKLVPMAQRLYPNSILVHGSIPLRISSIPTAALLKVRDAEKMQGLINRSSVSVQNLVSGIADLKFLTKSLMESFRNVFQGDIKTMTIEAEALKALSESAKNWQIKLTG